MGGPVHWISKSYCSSIIVLHSFHYFFLSSNILIFFIFILLSISSSLNDEKKSVPLTAAQLSILLLVYIVVDFPLPVCVHILVAEYHRKKGALRLILEADVGRNRLPLPDQLHLHSRLVRRWAHSLPHVSDLHQPGDSSFWITLPNIESRNRYHACAIFTLIYLTFCYERC